MHQSLFNQTIQIELERLPSIPHALIKLLAIVHDPQVEFSQITQIIQSDPALTTRIMSVANSGAYYQWNESKDFHRMVVALGLNRVKNIAINSAVQQFFSQFNVDDKGLLSGFWKSSLNTACMAKNLAHITGYPNEDEAYVAGLLHKVGELICLMHDADEYLEQNNKLLSGNHTDTLTEFEAKKSKMETAFIGSSIPEIGAWIIQKFDKKTLLSDAILYQREPSKQLIGTPPLVQLINLAHKLSEPFDHRDDVFADVAEVYSLNQAVLEDLLQQCDVEVRQVAKIMAIKINDDNSIETDNEEVQIKLAENVRNIALSSSLQNIGHFRSEKELTERIMQNLRMLFGISNCLYLDYDEQSNCLNACYGMNIEQSLLEQFKIPLDATITFPVQSILKGVPVFSNDDHESNQKSVLDRQLLRLLNADESLCIPLLETLTSMDSARDTKYGVLVAGVSASHLQALRREKGLLYEFSRSTSEVVSRDKKTIQRIKSIVDEEKAQQSLAIRQLVHEANNPLGVIRNYLQVLSHKLSDSRDKKLKDQLEILMEEVERVGNIVLRIRETPEGSILNSNQVNINDLVSRLISIFNDSLFLKAGINVVLNLDASIPVIDSNANSIKQILTNLLKNASEAMPEGGEVQIATRDQVNYNGMQFIELCVIDNGPGIPEEIMNNLFSPVQSTKSKEHSGLGLSIIKNLVNDLGGTIRGSNRHAGQESLGLDQQEITGAEFIILLPRRLIPSSA